MVKVEFLGGKVLLLFLILVEGLNIIQFSQSKNEGNPKRLVYFMISMVAMGFSQPAWS